MRYVLMYLVCGSFWALYFMNAMNDDGKFGEDEIKDLKKELFMKTGRDYSMQDTHKFLLIGTFIAFAAIWPHLVISYFWKVHLSLWLKRLFKKQ